MPAGGAGRDTPPAAAAPTNDSIPAASTDMPPPAAKPTAATTQDVPVEQTDDPIGDLEPTAHLDDARPAIGEGDRIPGERLAGRQDPANGGPGRSLAVGIAPAVGQVGDDQVARTAVAAEVDGQLVLEQEPAPSGHPPAKLEGQASEHCRAVG
jgi:hypothetical protein